MRQNKQMDRICRSCGLENESPTVLTDLESIKKQFNETQRKLEEILSIVTHRQDVCLNPNCSVHNPGSTSANALGSKYVDNIFSSTALSGNQKYKLFDSCYTSGNHKPSYVDSSCPYPLGPFGNHLSSSCSGACGHIGQNTQVQTNSLYDKEYSSLYDNTSAKKKKGNTSADVVVVCDKQCPSQSYAGILKYPENKGFTANLCEKECSAFTTASNVQFAPVCSNSYQKRCFGIQGLSTNISTSTSCISPSYVSNVFKDCLLSQKCAGTMTTCPNYTFIDKPCGHPCTNSRHTTIEANDNNTNAGSSQHSSSNNRPTPPQEIWSNDLHIFLHDNRQNVTFDNNSSNPVKIQSSKTAMGGKVSFEKFQFMAQQKEVGVMTSEILLSSTSMKKSSSIIKITNFNKKDKIKEVPSTNKKPKPPRTPSPGRPSNSGRPSSPWRPSSAGRPTTQVIMYPDKGCTYSRCNSSPTFSTTSNNCQAWYQNPCYNTSWSNSNYGYGCRRHC